MPVTKPPLKDAPRRVGPGDRGPDVLAYKLTLRQMGVLDDHKRIVNRYGPGMERAVKVVQAEHGLAQTGRIGPKTYDVLRPNFTDYSAHLIRKWARAHLDRSFVLPIAHHEPGGRFVVGIQKPVRAVLHDTESHDVPHSIGDLVGVISFWKRNPFPGGSLAGSQFLVDGDGFIAQIGTLSDILQHTGGANTGSIGIEEIGFARFTRAVWLARTAQLDGVAKILAYLNHVHDVPLVKSTSAGVSTHAMQSRIHPESLGHTDPGVFYPFRFVMNRARGYVAAGGWVDNH